MISDADVTAAYVKDALRGLEARLARLEEKVPTWGPGVTAAPSPAPVSLCALCRGLHSAETPHSIDGLVEHLKEVRRDVENLGAGLLPSGANAPIKPSFTVTPAMMLAAERHLSLCGGIVHRAEVAEIYASMRHLDPAFSSFDGTITNEMQLVGIREMSKLMISIHRGGVTAADGAFLIFQAMWDARPKRL